ncbi:MAG: PH domain-containing protein [Patescibacteria group bacterium]
MYLFYSYGWWLTGIGLGLIYLSWAMYFGHLNTAATEFLGNHPEWFIDVGMLSQWCVLFGISFIFVAYLRANVMYRSYKFILDEYALHLHRGILFIHETTIPYQQISNVHIDRPYHFRMCGLARLDIVTSSDNSREEMQAKNRKFLIPIIDIKVARKLSKILLEGTVHNNQARFRKDLKTLDSKQDIVEEEDTDDSDHDFEDDEDVRQVLR